MRNQHKKYTRPTNLFSTARIESDKAIVKKYGLKSRTEIWKADSKVSRIRDQAKKLIGDQEKQQDFFKKLEKMGFIKKANEATIDVVLSLTKEDMLERRFQTIILKLGLAKTIKEARQVIVHRKIKIGPRIVTSPSYIVKLEEENKISLIKSQKKPKQEQEPIKQEEKKE